jgi:hypothetical protein
MCTTCWEEVEAEWEALGAELEAERLLKEKQMYWIYWLQAAFRLLIRKGSNWLIDKWLLLVITALVFAWGSVSAAIVWLVLTEQLR